MAYSQELWRDFLRDFVVEVAQRPVVLAGNSIGGFIGASLAADNPTLVQGEPFICTAGCPSIEFALFRGRHCLLENLKYTLNHERREYITNLIQL